MTRVILRTGVRLDDSQVQSVADGVLVMIGLI